jgi:hypothetical protein
MSKQHKRWDEKDGNLVEIFGDLYDKYLPRKDKPRHWAALASMLGRTPMACMLYYSRYLRRTGQVKVGEVRHAHRV